MSSRPAPTLTPIERFARAYSDAQRRRRAELAVLPAGSDRRFMVELLGIQPGTGTIIISAPASPSGAVAAVQQGQILSCTWMNPSTVFHFKAVVSKLAFEPLPMLYLSNAHAIQAVELRDVPRARVALGASLRTPAPLPAVVTDLSVGGARIGVHDLSPLAVGQEAVLALKTRMFETDFSVDLLCKLVSDQGILDAAHPEVRFYGANFTAADNTQRLVLHGIVQEHLAREADRLGQLLLSEANLGPGT